MQPATLDMSIIENRAPDLAVQFRDRVQATPDRLAYSYPAAEGEPWQEITWRETGERVDKLAAGLLSLGLEAEQRVGIASSTRVEWILADLAIMCAGGATTTVYPTTIAEDVAYILADSECRVVFAEDAEQVSKLHAHRSELPHLEKVVLFEGTPDGEWVIGLDDLAALGEKYLADHPDALTNAIESIKPDSLATLIYTSGTTGRPKGVRLPHSAWTYEGAAVQAYGILSEDDLQFLWLPLAHSFGKVLLSTQLAIGFPTAVDGRPERIVENLGVVKPTFMGAAPRIFEKAHARIVTMQEHEGGLKYKLFSRAFQVGLKVNQLERDGKSVPFPLRLQHGLLDKLVFSKIRERFGGRVRFFISGAAALNREIAEWFDAAGITILEGYGLTETSAGTFVNRPWDNKFGTVGPVFPGSRVRLGEDDEIQVSGPGVMQGYHNLPEETEKTLTEDGWLRTGDKGAIDSDGFLAITGRIKELFKTSGGKYIAPPVIEAKFKALCPYVSQFVVFGSERNYCVALITLDADTLVPWAEGKGLGGTPFSVLTQTDEVKEMVGGYVEQLNAELNRWETIKKWRILDYDLSVETGEITPSMKVKRNVVEDKHKRLIDDMYS